MFTQICLVVDRFTKVAGSVPMQDQGTALDVARAFLEQVWKIHGLQKDIISDRATKFKWQFWTVLCKLLNIKYSKSTADHPKTDRKTE